VIRSIAACCSLLAAAGAQAATVDALRAHVEFLAAERLEGRMTGSEGERLAAEYVARQLEEIGARPLPGAAGLIQGFEFTAGTNDVGSTLQVTAAGEGGSASFTGAESVRALSFSENGSVRGGVVFAGYGLTIPESQEFSYDSYHGLDVKDKIVLVLRYSPEGVEGDLRAELTRYSGLRYKALQARDRGARALLVVAGPSSANAGETVDSGFDAALSGSGIVAASIGGQVAEALFAGVEGGLAGAQSALDTGNPHVTGFELPDVEVALDVKVEREHRTGRNVVGWFPPAGEAAGGPRYVVLGAHYDHLGRGKHGNSRAGKDEEGQVHLGADDNASGVAAVLEAGRSLAAKERRRGLVLAFWSGEEIGLLGSAEFVKSGAIPAESIDAYVNFDMVGRAKDGRLNLQGVGSSTVWPRLIEQTNVAVGLDVRTQEDPYLPTDASTFYLAKVPVLAFFTGNHDDYHRPSDAPGKLNWEDLERITRFAAILAAKLDRLEEAPDYVEVERSLSSVGSRDAVRAYTGTIPDYATEVEGLRLSGVIGGGPADRAGLQEGDVIVEFAGRAIQNIYDYTFALDAIKIDVPIQVVFLRDGRRMERTITPTSRP
jgi:hypothetical protein